MAAASAPIEIRGRYFWRGNERFLIRGAVYQDYNHTQPRDEIADGRLAQLEHDVELFKELGLNAILVYSIDPTKCHDEAMKLLQDAGIYVLVTIATPQRSINRIEPYDSYNAETLSHYFRAADVLAAYPNCLGLLAANEVINNRSSLRAARVIRAVVRDIKQYLRLKHEVIGQRVLPVGYSAADVRDLELPTRDYLSAGDEASRIDFWAKNDYSWASPSNMQISGYNAQVERYSNFNIPAFFSEYGANTNAPRDFGETAAMLSPEMTHVFSGGFAYEFWRGGNAYGLVKRVTGEEASIYRRAYSRLQTASAESLSRDLAKISLHEYIETEEGDYIDNRRGLKRQNRHIVDYRETSVGEILLYKDFFNLKERIADMKAAEANTNPDWTNSEVTAARAPSFPHDRRFNDIGEEKDVPPTCVDWQGIEETVRDAEYVLVSSDK